MAAFSLTSTADAIIRSTVAVLTLIAVVLVAVGLVRAWMGRRRAQVIIEDVVSVDGIPSSATAGLSPQLRLAVRQALLRETQDASYSVLNTLERDIKGGLLRAHARVQVKTIAAGLRSTTEDSLKTLAAGVRAVAPKEAEGLVAALGAALPSQRGWAIRVFPALRGTGPEAEAGVAVELAELGHPPDAVTTFWTSSDELRSAASDGAQAAAVRSSLYRLLDPAAAWIATRLVSRQLAQSSVPMRWRLLFRRSLGQELAGLQMQLAGQMSLYATRKQKNFVRGFADQALADLADSARLLRAYFRPSATEAAVHERLGWSYRGGGETQNAEHQFEKGIRCYDEAEQLLLGASDASPVEREAALDRVRVRRAKCRLLSGNPGQVVVARQELAVLVHITRTTALELYNCACMFAVAMGCPEVPAEEQTQFERHAWHLLGRALLADGADGPWTSAITDEELEAMDKRQRESFCDEIKARHPTLTPLVGERALPVVRDAMRKIGIDPL